MAEEKPLSRTSRRLKDRTKDAHTRVETGLQLLDTALTPARLAQVLQRFHGFWAVAEPAIDAWAGSHPETAAELDWPRRRRTHAIEADLRDLGHEPPPSPPATVVFSPGALDTAQVLGWLYVAEGSTLGGAVIQRHLAGEPAVVGVGLNFFVPYAEGPGPMWRSFLETLDRWTAADDTRAARVEDAAARVFDSLAAWLAPVMLDAAA